MIVKGAADRVYSVLASLANIRRVLNESLESAIAVKKSRQQEKENITKKSAAREAESAAEEAQQRQRKLEQAAARKPGLGAKWGVYNQNLKYKGQKIFRQYVPPGAASIQRALETQNILDAVYHKDKAFWISTKEFELASSAGKTEMRYFFDKEGARSLMEDYLICAEPGVFDKDNEEEWSGETGHPLYTLWKPSEVGAYGVGADRLKELAGHVLEIEAYSADGKKIVAKTRK